MWQNVLKIVAYSSHKCTSEHIVPLNQFLIFVNFEDWAQIKFWDVWGCLGNFKGFLRNLKLRNEDIFVTNFLLYWNLCTFCLIKQGRKCYSEHVLLHHFVPSESIEDSMLSLQNFSQISLKANKLKKQCVLCNTIISQFLSLICWNILQRLNSAYCIPQTCVTLCLFGFDIFFFN